MKRFFVSLLFSLAAQGSPSLHHTATLPYLPHHGPGPLDTWVGMNLPYAPAKQILGNLERRFSQSLKNLGEAHITVITPPEYYQALRSVLTISEIDQIVTASHIQSAPFKVICVGRSSATLDQGRETVYFLVVSSRALVEIRSAIYRRYVSKGGNPRLFNPRAYFPHITLGYTLRDLFERDGVQKDERTCL